MTVVYKSKSEVRQETEAAVAAFLRAGGSVEVVKARKAPKSKMRSRSSKGFASGSSGFAVGYPSNSFGG
jgi:hypothetical protein